MGVPIGVGAQIFGQTSSGGIVPVTANNDGTLAIQASGASAINDLSGVIGDDDPTKGTTAIADGLTNQIELSSPSKVFSIYNNDASAELQFQAGGNWVAVKPGASYENIAVSVSAILVKAASAVAYTLVVTQ